MIEWFERALTSATTRILIATPTLAEMWRANPLIEVPRVKQIQVVPFDLAAAKQLAFDSPQDWLVEQRASTGDPISFFKYDALIISCAKRHLAEAIITLDKGMKTRAARVQLECFRPSDLLDPQLLIPLS